MDANLQAYLVGIVVMIGCGVVARIVPKKKVIAFCKFWGDKIGTVISVLLLKHLTKKAAENIEEGILSTILAGIDAFIDSFSIALLKDNTLNKKD